MYVWSDCPRALEIEFLHKQWLSIRTENDPCRFCNNGRSLKRSVGNI